MVFVFSLLHSIFCILHMSILNIYIFSQLGILLFFFLLIICLIRVLSPGVQNFDSLR